MIDANAQRFIQAPCGIFSFTEEGTITFANAYCCRLLEYDKEELQGENISSLLTVSGRIFYQTHFYPLVKLHQHVEEIFLNLQTKSKKDLPVVLNAVVEDTIKGVEILCSFIQVLNRRKYEDEILLAKKNAEEALNKNKALEKVKQQLEQQQEVLDKQVTRLKYQNDELLQLGNLVTHDLQEPVRKLILFSTELLEGNIHVNKKDHALSVIKKSSQKVKRLLLNLQEYLGMTADAAKRTQVDLNEVIQSELEQLKKMYSEINLEVKTTPLPIIKGISEQLHFMFYHLLKNAFDHGAMENNLNLSIKAVIVKENMFNSINYKYSYIDFARITISDKGAGFDNRYNEYIFDVLKRLNSSVDTAGFGLAFCKKIAENHFGNIKADSNFGSGATFTVMLPINYNY